MSTEPPKESMALPMYNTDSLRRILPAHAHGVAARALLAMETASAAQPTTVDKGPAGVWTPQGHAPTNLAAVVGQLVGQLCAKVSALEVCLAQMPSSHILASRLTNVEQMLAVWSSHR